MTGHVCRHPVLEIGETVMFKVVMDKTHRHKADTDWCEGIFLGVETCNTQFLIMSRNGLFKTSHHNVKRVVKERSDQYDLIKDMNMDYSMYLKDGASTSDPVGNPQAEPSGGAGAAAVGGGRSYIPRSSDNGG